MNTSLVDFCRAEIAALKDAKTWETKGRASSRIHGGARARGRPRRRPHAHLEQLPRVREPPAHRGGRERRARQMGQRPRLVRFIAARRLFTRSWRRRFALLRDRGHDPVHVVLERERGPLRAPPRRGGRAPLGRPQPRLDHRRRAPVQGEALSHAPRRPRGARDGPEGSFVPEAPLSSRTASFPWRARSGRSASSRTSAEGYDTAFVVDDSRADGSSREDRARLGRGGGCLESRRALHVHARKSNRLGHEQLRQTGPAPVVDLLRQRSRTSLFQRAPTRGRGVFPRGVPHADGARSPPIACRRRTRARSARA